MNNASSDKEKVSGGKSVGDDSMELPEAHLKNGQSKPPKKDVSKPSASNGSKENSSLKNSKNQSDEVS